MSVNFMKVHQPNMPHPDFKYKSDKNTYVFWRDPYSRAAASADAIEDLLARMWLSPYAS